MQKTAIKVAPSRLKVKWLLGACLTLSVGMAVVAIFSVANWAETASWHHAVQHVLIFAGGIGVGSSLLGVKQGEETHES